MHQPRIYGFAHLATPATALLLLLFSYRSTPRHPSSVPPLLRCSLPEVSTLNPNAQIPTQEAGNSEELSMSRHPSTKWAQRSDKVYLTIELPDAKDVKFDLKPDGHFSFSAKAPAEDIPYELDLELFDAVNVEESKAAVAPRTICYLIKKAESKWWPRMLKKEGKPPVFLKVDWDKWQDEDDEDVGFGDFGDMDFSKLDMGGADDDIEEDEEDDVVDSANKDDEDTEAEGSSKGQEAPVAAVDETKP